MILQPSRAGFHKLGATEIRVVDIQPGQFDDPIQVSIRVVDFQDEPQYEALSYVWNPTTGPINPRNDHDPKILVTTASSATYLPIGWNLDIAIRHLRHKNTVLTMWIDAISINQEDTSERNHQVGLMGTVYSSAERVVVWLGPASEYSDFVMETISTGKLRKKNSSKFRFGLESILMSDWFYRIWVVQEIALAAEDPRLHCGLPCVNWSQFVVAVQFAIGTKSDFDGDCSGTYDDLGKRSWIASACGPTEQVTNLAAIRTRGRTASFSQQFSTTLLFRSTDPRDKVYGLLGISCFRGTPIVPDYAKSWQEVFAEATAMIMLEDFTLYAQLQMWARGDIGFSSYWSTPTWTSDLKVGGMPFSRIDFIPPDNSLENTLVRARGVAPLVEFLSDSKVLHTVGHHIGELEQCAEINCGVKIELISLRQAHEKLHKDGLQDYTKLMISALLNQKGPRCWHRKDKLRSSLRECFTPSLPINKTTSDPKHMSKEHASQESNGSYDSDTDTDSEVEVEWFKGTSRFDHATDFCIFTTKTGMLGIANKSLASRDMSSVVLVGLFGITCRLSLNICMAMSIGF
jgi:hypothetical protein